VCIMSTTTYVQPGWVRVPTKLLQPKLEVLRQHAQHRDYCYLDRTR
jgi:hypothetical protein